MEALSLGIPAVRYRPITRSEREMLQGFPRVDIGDQDFHKG